MMSSATCSSLGSTSFIHARYVRKALMALSFLGRVGRG